MKTWIRRLFATTTAPITNARFRPAFEGLEARDCPAAFATQVPATSNIFGAGHPTPPEPGGGGAGTLPPMIRITPGTAQVLTFGSVTGDVSCCGPGTSGLDGGTNASGTTNITSFGGISGIIHTNRTMFLTGVFLTDAEPTGTGPERLSFSDPENFTDLKPVIGQTFFIGDGKTDAGQLQQFHVPAGATRLYLGFADALEFGHPVSAPGYYFDNVGTFAVSGEIKESAPPDGSFALDVDGKSNVFGAGHTKVPGDGLLPPVVRIDPAAGQVVTFSDVTGSVSLRPGVYEYNGPDGGTLKGGKTNISSVGGISGISHSTRTLFLIGVFLTDAEPSGAGPERLSFSDPDNTTDLRPVIGQTFFIGDGKTDAGQLQKFHVPAGATRLYFGFADSGNLANPAVPPGCYGDNGGKLAVVGSISTPTTQVDPPVTDPVPPPMTDLVAGSVRRVPGGGVTATYAVTDSALSAPARVELVWTNAAGKRLGTPIPVATLPAGTEPGEYVARIAPSRLSMRPFGATHLQLVLDRSGSVAEADEFNNAVAVRLPAYRAR